jgi:hypothetical protein
MSEILAPFQRRDEHGIVEPWFTHGALDEIAEWDLHDKTVWEWGGGYSTRWWASRAKRVYTVEHIGDNPEWREKIQAFAVEYRNINLRLCDSQSYATIPEGIFPDIVVVDGVYRTECIEWVLEHLLRPFTLIVDNWQQPGVYVDPKSDKLLEDIPGRIHSQVGYAVPTHMPWQTGIWKIR